MIVFIKQNSPEIRKKLGDAGYSVCHCAEFEDAIWLDYHPFIMEMYRDIHGVGYTDECEGLLDWTPEERIKAWLGREDFFDEDREFYDTVEQFLEKYPIPKIRTKNGYT